MRRIYAINESCDRVTWHVKFQGPVVVVVVVVVFILAKISSEIVSLETETILSHPGIDKHLQDTPLPPDPLG